jgi:hypothetical protein
MQGFRIKVRAVGPDKRVNFRVYAHLAKHRQIAQRAVQSAMKNWLEVDYLLCSIVEMDTEGIGAENFGRSDAADGVMRSHGLKQQLSD